MPRDKRSRSPEQSHGSYKRSKQSHRSSRSPSPTRRPRNARPDYRDRDRRDDRDSRKRDDRRRSRSRDRDRERRDRERRPLTPPRSRPIEVEKSKVATPPVPEDPKIKAKRERLEAWKKEREAKKALDEAKAKAMALAGKSVPTGGSSHSIHLSTS